MRLDTVIARLQAQVPALRAVYGALEAATPPSYPVAYVYPLRTDTDPDVLLGVHEQRLVERIGVELLVRQAQSAAAGGPAQDLLEDLRDAIQAALCGWPPTADAAPIQYAGGELVAFDAGLASWRETFTTEHYLRIAA